MPYKSELNLQPFPTRICTVGGGHNPIEGGGSFLCGLTQLVEFAPFKGDVVGSSPTAATLRAYFNGRMAVSKTAYGGSNPPAFGINWRLPKYTVAAGRPCRTGSNPAHVASGLFAMGRYILPLHYFVRKDTRTPSRDGLRELRYKGRNTGLPVCASNLEASGKTDLVATLPIRVGESSAPKGTYWARCASIHYGVTRA